MPVHTKQIGTASVIRCFKREARLFAQSIVQLQQIKQIGKTALFLKLTP